MCSCVDGSLDGWPRAASGTDTLARTLVCVVRSARSPGSAIRVLGEPEPASACGGLGPGVKRL